MSEEKTSLVGKPSQVHCEVCNVFLSSASLLPTHIKGKKHQSLQKVREAQNKATAQSVYVTGLKCSETTEDEVSTFFSCFGEVKKIYFDKNKGAYAIIEFEDEKSVSNILEKEEPVVFKRKQLKIKRRTFTKQKTPEKQEASGTLEPNPRKRKKRRLSEAKTSSLSNEIIDQLTKLDTVSQQIDLLMSELCLTEEDIQLRSLVCKVLEEVLKEFSPSVEVVPYGSSANGLGCKGTDLDITVLADQDILNSELDVGDETETKGSKLYLFLVKVLRSLVPGCSHVIPIYYAKCPVIKFTHQTSGLSCDLTVNNRLGIQNTKLLRSYLALDPRVAQLVFIVRAWAKSLGISSGSSGQLTSYALTVMVIHFLQTTNPPVIPSLQNISGWPMNAEMKDAGEEKGLQDCFIDGWNCSFFEDITLLSPSLNDRPVEKLLEDFFEYYANKFDYGNCAVNIRKAERYTLLSLEDELREIDVERTNLEQTNERGSLCDPINESGMKLEMKADKVDHGNKSKQDDTSEDAATAWKTTSICVQDPFELTHNLTQNIGVPSLKNIIHCMMDGARVCSAFPSDGHLGDSNGIASFFCGHTKTPTKRKKREGYSFSVYLGKKSEQDEAVPAGGMVCARYSNSEQLFIAFCKYVEHDLQMKCDLEGECGEQDSKSHLSATCTALTNTWTHCRRERRKIKGKDGLPAAGEEEGEKPKSAPPESSLVQDPDAITLEQAEASSAHLEQGTDKNPVLVFKLILDEKKDSSGEKNRECVVKMEHIGGTGLQTFENFYAFFKKQIHALFT